MSGQGSGIADSRFIQRMSDKPSLALESTIMTDARWQKTYDLMVTSELLKPMPNWKDAYTLQFVKDLK